MVQVAYTTAHVNAVSKAEGVAVQITAFSSASYYLSTPFFFFTDCDLTPDWPDWPGNGFFFLKVYALLPFLTSMDGLGKTSSLLSSLPFSTGTHSPYTLSASFFLCWDPDETGNSFDRLTWFFGCGGGAGFMLGVLKQKKKKDREG